MLFFFEGQSRKTRRVQRLRQGLQGETCLVRHVVMAMGQCFSMPVDDVQRRNRASLRGVGGITQLVLGHQLAHRLQIRAGDDQEAIGFEHPQEFLEHLRHLMGVDVLYCLLFKNRKL